ncbi:MAG: signal peptidase I [Anaerolineaceae bacterium]|nr:signal peptidase I [Anaerolineaceae bacterium]
MENKPESQEYATNTVLEVEENPSETTNWLLEIFQIILITLILYFAIDAFVGRVRVESISMLDTIQPNEFLLIFKPASWFDHYQRGDVVVFHYPLKPEEDYVKRVIGLPGDTVSVHDRQVYVNGEQLTEPYIKEAPTYTGVWEVPDGYLFVLGDNRNMSSDSHSWGFVPLENVFGRVIAIYWPLSELNLLGRINPLRATS